jgi:site-specific DNA recombinase
MKINPRKSKRGVWNTSTLSHLLRHKVYIGETHWGSSYAVVPEKTTNHEKYKKIKKSSRRKRPEEEWIKIPVPKIIEPELFEQANKQLKDNFALCQRNKKNEYLLSGMIKCTCGRNRAGEGAGGGTKFTPQSECSTKVVTNDCVKAKCYWVDKLPAGETVHCKSFE